MAQSTLVEWPIRTKALLQVADFLARTQRFVAVAEAGTGVRETLEQTQTRIIVLTNNGAPAAAIVPALISCWLRCNFTQPQPSPRPPCGKHGNALRKRRAPAIWICPRSGFARDLDLPAIWICPRSGFARDLDLDDAIYLATAVDGSPHKIPICFPSVLNTRKLRSWTGRK